MVEACISLYLQAIQLVWCKAVAIPLVLILVLVLQGGTAGDGVVGEASCQRVCKSGARQSFGETVCMCGAAQAHATHFTVFVLLKQQQEQETALPVAEIQSVLDLRHKDQEREKKKKVKRGEGYTVVLMSLSVSCLRLSFLYYY